MSNKTVCDVCDDAKELVVASGQVNRLGFDVCARCASTLSLAQLVVLVKELHSKELSAMSMSERRVRD